MTTSLYSGRKGQSTVSTYNSVISHILANGTWENWAARARIVITKFMQETWFSQPRCHDRKMLNKSMFEFSSVNSNKIPLSFCNSQWGTNSWLSSFVKSAALQWAIISLEPRSAHKNAELIPLTAAVKQHSPDSPSRKVHAPLRFSMHPAFIKTHSSTPRPCLSM